MRKKVQSWRRDGLILLTGALMAAFAVFYAAFYLVYSTTLRQLNDSAAEETGRQMNAVSEETSASFQREWAQMMDVQFVEKVKKQFTAEGTGRDTYNWYYRLLNLKTELSSRFRAGTVFHDTALLILTEDRDYLCTTRFISDHFRRDWENGLFRFEENDYDAFLNLLRASASRRYRLTPLQGTVSYRYDTGYEARSALYVYACTQSNAFVQIYAILQMDLDSLRARYTSLRYTGEDFLLDTDADRYGALLTDNGEGICTDGAGNRWLRTSIDRTGLSGLLKLDQNAIREQIDSFTTLLRVLPAVFIVLLIILSVLLFLRWHYPVLRIAERIGGTRDEDRSPAARIGSRITELEEENLRFQNRLEGMRSDAEEKLLERFLNGEELKEEEQRAAQRWLGPECEKSYRCAVTAPLTDTESGPELIRIMEDSAGELVRGIYACTAANGKMVTLILDGEGSDESFFADQRTLLDALNDAQTGAVFATGVSERYVGPASVPAAYREALSGWKDAMLWQNASVVYHAVRGGEANSYHFGYQQLEEMSGALRSGRAEWALGIFDAVAAENFDPKRALQLRQMICRQFYEDILGLLVRLSAEYDIASITDALAEKAGQGSLREQIARLRAALSESAELIGTAAERRDGLAGDIQAYCRQRLSDPMLSLRETADHFGLTESNLSKFFKSHTGVSFSAYVEKLRIRRADELLLEGKMNVKQAALAVGYQNTATFYNAFRRVHQCTPTQWQEQFGKGENSMPEMINQPDFQK